MQFLHTFISYSKGNTEILQGEASEGPPGSLFQVKPHLKKYTPSNYNNFMTKIDIELPVRLEPTISCVVDNRVTH